MVLQSMRKVKRNETRKGSRGRVGSPQSPDSPLYCPEMEKLLLALQGPKLLDVLIKMIVGEARDPGTGVATPLIVFEAAEEAKETSMARLEKMDAFFKREGLQFWLPFVVILQKLGIVLGWFFVVMDKVVEDFIANLFPVPDMGHDLFDGPFANGSGFGLLVL